MATTEPQAYGYAAIPLTEHGRPPYRGQVLAYDIERAWQEVHGKFADWRLGHYKVFVYSWMVNPSEYQAANLIVKEGELFELHLWPAGGMP